MADYVEHLISQAGGDGEPEPAERELTDSEKLDYLFQVAVKADKLMQEVGPQIGPILAGVSNNPMLKMFMR